MRGRFAALAAVVVLAACTTTKSHTFTAGFERPAAGAAILLVEPDIELAVLTAAGLPEPREDWTQAARANVARAIAAQLAERGRASRAYAPADTGREGQLMRLHAAVGASILLFNYGYVALPTKEDNFDWTLGPGAREIAEAQGARYALITYARGHYASTGRVVMALLFGGPVGGQQIFASLVDLHTGDIIWFNVATTGPNADMRQEAGAAALVRALLEDAPL